MTAVVESSAFLAEAEHGHSTTFCRWAARSPEGPSAVEWEKDLMAALIFSGDCCRAGSRPADCGSGGTGVPCGCFDRNWPWVEEEESAIPSDVNAEHARDRSPSEARVLAR